MVIMILFLGSSLKKIIRNHYEYLVEFTACYNIGEVGSARKVAHFGSWPSMAR